MANAGSIFHQNGVASFPSENNLVDEKRSYWTETMVLHRPLTVKGDQIL
jgi:hypothetical protein